VRGNVITRTCCPSERSVSIVAVFGECAESSSGRSVACDRRCSVWVCEYFLIAGEYPASEGLARVLNMSTDDADGKLYIGGLSTASVESWAVYSAANQALLRRQTYPRGHPRTIRPTRRTANVEAAAIEAHRISTGIATRLRARTIAGPASGEGHGVGREFFVDSGRIRIVAAWS